jgi:gluconokinase
VPFVDADDLHPPANVAKMASGEPLTDADRWPWLDIVAARLRDAPDGVVIACSALKRSYRERLEGGAPDVRFLELRVPDDELSRRMTHRTHFMPASLLASQLQTWERLGPDEPGASIENDGDLDGVVARARAALEGGQSLR